MLHCLKIIVRLFLDLRVLNYLLLVPNVNAGDLFYYAMDGDFASNYNTYFGSDEDKETVYNHMENVSAHILSQLINDDSLEYGLSDLAMVLSQKTIKFNRLNQYSKCYLEDYNNYCRSYFQHLTKEKTVNNIEKLNQVTIDYLQG